ncbi:Gcd10p-domain-containing protein [Tuber magnatum]|uniref:tRNA (adenine(58)-N(1))-methyltransferase non-catalytic subunit TRM6 n=1 Tax=Tuber magnatum TaxID=42249 RepID=A0A317SEJ1_9PEZI|nr:Gcd10p-domain-containing protein [Tuber magnatum]
MPEERILPYTHLLLRLPSGAPRVVRLIPDITISLGKFGSFPSNALLYRPYNLTFDILDPPAVGLRLVSAEEVTRDILGGGEDAEVEGTGHYDLEIAGDSEEDGGEVMRTNKETIDDPLSQKLSWVEIEQLKKQGTSSGRKYTLRKTKKFLRRFTALPLTVASLTTYLLDTKEPIKILEMRNETIAVMLSLANVRYGGRYLVIDESGGLLVSAIAERLDLLEHMTAEFEESKEEDTARKRYPDTPLPTTNTITLIHPNEQPNLSLLKYFSYDTNRPTASHPLHTHLRTLNWLQLVDPNADSSLEKPEEIVAETLATLKGGKRAAYWRKHRRWGKTSRIVAETQKGGFDGLLVAAFMDLKGILRHTVPLLKGSAQIVAYSQNRESVIELADCYSAIRKAEWMNEGQVAADGEDGVGDPTTVLAPTVHETRVREWQVLPGRTHPVMTARGGAEGVVFAGTRVLPVEGKVEARGRFRGQKRRKDSGDDNGDEETDPGGTTPTSPLKRVKAEI